jgi:predicted nucleic acid-binding protein
MGTVVHEGSADALVVAIGRLTQFGRIAVGLGVSQPQTEFQLGLTRFSGLLARVGAVLSVTILVVNLLLGRSVIEAVLLAGGCRGHHPTAASRRRVDEPRCWLAAHRVTEDQEAGAWDWLRRHDERVYSYVDATSFRVMRDRRPRDALAFDQDFAAAGFIEVRPGPRR